jgi:nitrogen fixation protein NifB
MNEMLLKGHPCFDKEAAGHIARVHLPVAPKCNIQCKYCSRKYDCINEGRPGVSSAVLSPAQATLYLEKISQVVKPGVVGIAGPGDAFAEPEKTLETLDRCRRLFPEMLFCLSTNGLNALDYVDAVASLGVTHVTVTINALDPRVATSIYSWVRFKKRNYRGLDAAEILLERQIETVRRLKERGLIVKINTLLIPGINEGEIPSVARKACELGCDLMNIIPLIPVKWTEFADLKEPSCKIVEEMRSSAGTYIRQSRHCKRCRADAAGLLGDDMRQEISELLRDAANTSDGFSESRSKIAFVSREGVLVNTHLGEAEEVFIAEYVDGEAVICERRPAPARGGGDARWKELARLLDDCAYLLVGGVGERPGSVLAASGLKVLVIEGVASEAAFKLFHNADISYLKKRQVCAAGKTCVGAGTGCT